MDKENRKLSKKEKKENTSKEDSAVSENKQKPTKQGKTNENIQQVINDGQIDSLKNKEAQENKQQKEKEKKIAETKRPKIDTGIFHQTKSESKEFTSKEIFEMFSKENIHFTNDTIYLTLLKISKLGMNKQGYVCREIINAIKIIIQSYEDPKLRLAYVNKLIEITYKLTDVIGGLHNSLKFVKNILEKTQNKHIDKRGLISKLNEFLDTKINTKEYISNKHGVNLIKENDCILIYGKSQIFRSILKSAAEKQINFRVVYVDNRQNNYIKSEIEFLSKLGVNVVYSYLNGISGIIDKVTKVFVKAKSMLANGNLLGDVGTSLISCIANNFKKPVISFCETYKFWDKILMNSFQSNNLQIENVADNTTSYNRLNILYDVTPANYINMVVCEHGYIPPTSVPVVIREFEKEEVEFDQ